MPRATAGPPVESAARGPSEVALAYLASDGRVAIVNDYGSGRSEARWDPDPASLPEVASAWRASPARTGVGPLDAEEAVEGYGVFTFPYGPISMGVPESGRFDLRTYGERILALTPFVGYKSRRIVASVVGQRPEDAALRIERLAGNFAAAHASAFLAAVESARRSAVPRGELWVRALAQELQRIYNHLHVIARVAEAASQNVGAAQTHALAEELLRLEGSVFGHRWLFGALLPEGPARRLERSQRRELAVRCGELSDRFDRLWELFLESRTFIDRIQSTAPVPRDLAVRWGGVGPTLRASGVPWDDRLRVPVAPYTDLFLDLPHESGGDALARLLVRAHEIRASHLLVEQMLDRWPGDPSVPEDPGPAIAPGRGLGRVESPSGDLVYDVSMEDDRIVAVGLRTASRANFPLFARGLRDGVFTDFHFAWESFGLVFAEVDA
ncbi:MAG TPA: hypothetical protein VMG99_01435 [Thermoplasmata archaeon]|nr:hypothetical protein [Thermoplasmata archaeon]